MAVELGKHGVYERKARISGWIVFQVRGLLAVPYDSFSVRCSINFLIKIWTLVRLSWSTYVSSFRFRGFQHWFLAIDLNRE